MIDLNCTTELKNGENFVLSIFSHIVKKKCKASYGCKSLTFTYGRQKRPQVKLFILFHMHKEIQEG